MVRHVGAHRHHRYAFGQACRRKVERLVPAKWSASALLLHALEVADGGGGIDHRGKSGGVWRHHGLVAEAALQAQTGNAETRVLIGEFPIPGIECRFGNTPGQIPLIPILDLASDDQPRGFAEQAPFRLAHDKDRHEIFEHRPRPGDQRGPAVDGGQQSTQSEPMPNRQISLGNRQEAREPGLRREKIVATGVLRAVSHSIADGQQLALRLDQKSEFHGHRKGARASPKRSQARNEPRRGRWIRFDVAQIAQHIGAQHAGPMQQRRVAAFGTFVGQRLRDVANGIGLLKYGSERRRAAARVDRLKRRTQDVDRGVELAG